MGRDEGQVPAPRRTGLPGRRRAAAPDAPRVAEISALLEDLGALRTTLSADLSLAAAALEAGADELAGELVDGDLQAVRGFEQRALEHLRALDGAEIATPEAPAVVTPAAVPAARPLRRRLLPAAPVLAAAAAVVGLVAGVVPRSPAVEAPVMSSAAATSWELNRLADEGASAVELREVAEELNAQLAALVAVAGSDPAAAKQALLLLRDTAEVLREADDPAVLADVLREARSLAARLASVLPQQSPAGRTSKATAEIQQLLDPAQAQPGPGTAGRSGSSSAPASPKPAASAKPSPAATPKPAPQPSPTATPEPSTTPQPSQQPVLPPPGDLPGF